MLVFVTLILLTVPLNVDSVECPENSFEWRQREIIVSCPNGTYYHCLPDENGLTTELCNEKSWIQPGFCPIFDRESKRVDVRLCQESNGKCPLRTYWTNDVFKYTGCKAANYIRNVSVTGSRTTSRYAVKGTTSHAMTRRSASTERNTNGDNGNETSVAVIIVPIIVVLFLCSVAAALLLLYRRQRLKNDRHETPAEPGTLPLINTSSICKTDEDTVTTVAVQDSDGEKDEKCEYSAKIAEKAGPRLKENGILVFVYQSKKFMTIHDKVGQLLARTCDTQEFPSGFKEYLDSFTEMEKSTQKTKCVVFNDCFQNDKDTIRLSEYKSVFNELYEKQVASEGRLRFVIAIPMTVWNTRSVILSASNLFNEKHIFKINNPPS